MGVFALNKEYGQVKGIELELVERKLRKEEKEMKLKGEKYICEKEALRKYR